MEVIYGGNRGPVGGGRLLWATQHVVAEPGRSLVSCLCPGSPASLIGPWVLPQEPREQVRLFPGGGGQSRAAAPACSAAGFGTSPLEVCARLHFLCTGEGRFPEAAGPEGPHVKVESSAETAVMSKPQSGSCRGLRAGSSPLRGARAAWAAPSALAPGQRGSSVAAVNHGSSCLSSPSVSGYGFHNSHRGGACPRSRDRTQGCRD